ncbi:MULTISPECIES: recombinase family protein [Brevundimonas]|jgi:DNA invertase Pin-like site-specific DNA recombinase|uniref:Recombinase family protein n=2 Tax=Brevundimonas TaxID=41275 RepID=A0ABU4KQ45_BREVE|nr:MULTISPECIES: recombinase family protein [Brevundimonas]MDX2335136.1 recombinase family protein [Brevundimonas vesicularis]QIH74315.1 recombinase family protein [Brevundimonas mediterranea]
MLLGYARVSTPDQKLDLQIDALEKAGCERVFSEAASGVRSERTALRDALSHARSGDVFIVWKLDRLGRTVGQLVEFVRNLRERGVEFRSLTDGIDTTTPAGRFFFHMMAALAEMERDLIRERTMAGLAAARARGKQGGRRPILSERQLKQAKLLLGHPDQTMEGVASSLGVSRSTLYRAIARSAAAGKLGSR